MILSGILMAHISTMVKQAEFTQSVPNNASIHDQAKVVQVVAFHFTTAHTDSQCLWTILVGNILKML